MNESKIPFTGCYSSFATTISILNLQLMISTQFTDQECLNWEKSLKRDLNKSEINIIAKPITDRLKEAPLFLLNELRYSAISSAIVNFTSTTEHYLKDIIELSLQRNKGLRKKAFSERKINAIELEEVETLNEVKKNLFKVIAQDEAKGQLFKSKFKRASKFLEVKNPNIDNNLYNSLDSIWELRNKIAHSNNGFIQELEIKGEKNILITKEPSKAEYLNFCIEFLKIIDDFSITLKDWERIIMDKWPANSFIQ